MHTYKCMCTRLCIYVHILGFFEGERLHPSRGGRISDSSATSRVGSACGRCVKGAVQTSSVHIHTYIHTYIHTNLPTYLPTQVRTYVRTYTYVSLHVTHICVYINMYICDICMYVFVFTHAHACVCICELQQQVRIHTYTCTYTCMYIYMWKRENEFLVDMCFGQDFVAAAKRTLLAGSSGINAKLKQDPSRRLPSLNPHAAVTLTASLHGLSYKL